MGKVLMALPELQHILAVVVDLVEHRLQIQPVMVVCMVVAVRAIISWVVTALFVSSGVRIVLSQVMLLKQ
jgi:hypothetical protein